MDARSFVRPLLVAAAVAGGAAQAATVVDWASFAQFDTGSIAPNLIGAPDGATHSVPMRVAKFTETASYTTLAAQMGLSEAELASYDVLAWEANGGHAAASGGFESAAWTFSVGAASVSSTFNGLTGMGSNPAILFKTGSLSGAQYNSVFGTTVPDAEVWSWLLARMPAGIDARSASFAVDFVPVGDSAGLGEGSPNPDAVGVLSAVPEPSTYALMALGLAAIGAMARRRPR